MSKLKIALVVSHPIQHFCPQYVSLSKNSKIQLKVFFGSALGLKSYIDKQFNREVSWSNLNLDKIDHIFLNGDHAIPVDRNLDAPVLDKMLDEYKPDVIITYGYFQKLQRRATRWAKKNKTKIAYISDSERVHKMNAVKEFLKYPFLRWYFSSVDYFLSVGDFNEAFYKYYSVPSSKIIRMRFPIDVDNYRDSYNKKNQLNKEIRDQYKIADEDIVLSVVGKFVPSKRQADIIDAMVELERKNIFMHLFIVGSGETEKLLEEKGKALSKSKIYLTGFIGSDQLPSYYAATDMYIHPASLDRHSLAISEAIYMSCPVIVSNRCGSYGENDDVQDSKNGYVYECEDIADLSKKIETIIKNQQFRKEFSEYSHEIAEKFQACSHGGFIDELIARYNLETPTARS